MPKRTHGPVDDVPCPHCGAPNDLRGLAKDRPLDVGHQIQCTSESDPASHCRRVFIVTAIRDVTVVSVAKHAAKPQEMTMRKPDGGDPETEVTTCPSPSELSLMRSYAPSGSPVATQTAISYIAYLEDELERTRLDRDELRDQLSLGAAETCATHRSNSRSAGPRRRR